MSRGALSQWKNYCWDIISSLFSRKFYTTWAAGRDLVSIHQSSAMAVATEEMMSSPNLFPCNGRGVVFIAGRMYVRRKKSDGRFLVLKGLNQELWLTGRLS
jgi:hypothetical protein